jgi:phosphoribosylanthranilate isomerase
MRHVLVKIEGLRDPATAARVAELGADAIGLVFAPSPRRVSPERAREIVAALPPRAATVGVFVNAPADEINRVIDETGIQIVQLHGDEPPEAPARIHAPCIKAFRVRDEHWADEVRRWLAAMPAEARSITRDSHPVSAQAPECENQVTVPGFVPARVTALLDAYDPGVRGGSGRRFNWDWIEHARAVGDTRGPGAGDLPNIGPVILAGGLDAGNVAEAIRKVRPWAVDVASGVESSPGVKDLAKVKAFIEAVREAGS